MVVIHDCFVQEASDGVDLKTCTECKVARWNKTSKQDAEIISLDLAGTVTGSARGRSGGFANCFTGAVFPSVSRGS